MQNTKKILPQQNTDVPDSSMVKTERLFEKELKDELKRLEKVAGFRRDHLLMVGSRKTKLKKSLSIASGILALFSAGAISTILVNIFSSQALQGVAAITAGISGIISLFLNSHFSDDDIAKIYIGSSKYLSLRNRIFRASIAKVASIDERIRIVEELQTEYSNLDETYTKYLEVSMSSYSIPPSKGHGLDLRNSNSLVSKNRDE